MHLKTLLNQVIPYVPEDIHYYYIKTNNGRYYNKYNLENKVGLYNSKTKYLKQFIEVLKICDIVLIASARHKRISIGKITSDIYYENDGVFRKIEWLKEIESQELSDKIYKYISKVHHIININDLAIEIDRILYSIYDKLQVYHFVFKVKQEENILFKSLYGLQQLFNQDEFIDELKIKISVQSPGIIELITDNLDIIIMIIKTIKIINLLTKNERPDNPKFMKKFEEIKKKYNQYEIERLKLEIPQIDEEIYKNI